MLRLMFICLFFLLAVLFGSTERYFRRVCEGQAMSINCYPHVVNITSASYGRSRQGICGSNGNTNCHASNSVTVAKQECDGLESCTLYAKNSIFGDPCPGTFKYLNVTYNCVLSWRPEYRLRICEGDSQSISCVCHWSIGIISANYGRMAGGHICPGPINTTNCGAVGSLNITKTACQGKQYCDLQAKNSVYGDPCPGTRKYLEVRYRCQY
ncbi:rhamnose-binding lectin-like [Oculina patagonica]